MWEECSARDKGPFLATAAPKIPPMTAGVGRMQSAVLASPDHRLY